VKVPVGLRLYVRHRGFLDWEAELHRGQYADARRDNVADYYGFGLTRGLAIRSVLKSYRSKTSRWERVGA
jgi:hypothetical protein